MYSKGSSEEEMVRGKKEKKLIRCMRRIKYVGENQINKDDLKGPPHIRDFVLTCICIKRTLSMRLKNQEHALNKH
jgi:hypothetical protein